MPAATIAPAPTTRATAEPEPTPPPVATTKSTSGPATSATPVASAAKPTPPAPPAAEPDEVEGANLRMSGMTADGVQLWSTPMVGGEPIKFAIITSRTLGFVFVATQRYFHKYGIDPAKLAAIPLAFRRHARLNPGAVMQGELDLDKYLKSRYIIEPLRLLDCSVIVDGAVAMILTRTDRARDCPKAPVKLLGVQGLHAGPNEFIFGLRGLGIDQASVFDEQPRWQDQLVYRMAGVGPKDIGTLHIYDAFSPQLLFVLERFGFCAPGEAADWVQGGRIELGGELPCNTSGGHLSEGQLNGWGQILEIVKQLRGEAGARQIQDLRLAQWATTVGDSIIFGLDA